MAPAAGGDGGRLGPAGLILRVPKLLGRCAHLQVPGRPGVEP